MASMDPEDLNGREMGWRSARRVGDGDFFPVRGIEVWQMREWARTLRDVSDRLVSPAELAELDQDLPRIGQCRRRGVRSP
jgi:hypothetical protein